MSDVEFTDETQQAAVFKSRAILGVPQTPGITNFLMKRNIVKSEKQAHAVLLGCIVACIVLAVLVPVLFGPKSASTDPATQRLMQESMMRMQMQNQQTNR